MNLWHRSKSPHTYSPKTYSLDQILAPIHIQIHAQRQQTPRPAAARILPVLPPPPDLSIPIPIPIPISTRPHCVRPVNDAHKN